MLEVIDISTPVLKWYVATRRTNGALAIGYGATQVQALKELVKDECVIKRLRTELKLEL